MQLFRRALLFNATQAQTANIRCTFSGNLLDLKSAREEITHILSRLSGKEAGRLFAGVRINMAIRADYHLHSSFSGDSQAPMEEMILKGISLGLESMCFTEHQDMDYVYETPDREGLFEVNTDSYLYELIRCKEKYADKINVLLASSWAYSPT